MSDRFGASAERLAGAAAKLLGWRPEEFWRATPRELASALGEFAGEAGEPPERATIDALMERFPDDEGLKHG